jgi:hypothetical protein
MKQPQRAAQAKPDYPAESSGSRLVAKVRKLASKLTPEEEAEHFRRGMAKIYGSRPKEIIVGNSPAGEFRQTFVGQGRGGLAAGVQ